MGVLDILGADRVSVAGDAEGPAKNKAEAIARLAALLGLGQPAIPVHEVERVLAERERLQSTGIGGGVAIPHGVVERLEGQLGAVLLCPQGIDFDAIDSEPVQILFAVIGPKRATGEHLKTLARVSRLLRDASFRERLLAAPTGARAYELIAAEEGRGGAA